MAFKFFLILLDVFMLFVVAYGCGGDTNTCFSFDGSRPMIQMMEQGKQSHWRKQFFVVAYTLRSYQADNEFEINLEDAACKTNERLTQLAYVEQKNTCVKGDLTIVMIGRTYLQNNNVSKGGVNVDVTTGQAGFNLEITRAGVAKNLKNVTLKAKVHWDFPTKWFDFVFTEVNQFNRQAYETQNLFSLSYENNSLKSIHMNAIMKMDMLNTPYVLKCDAPNSCDSSPTVMVLNGDAEPYRKKLNFFYDINIPTAVDLTYTWSGEAPLLMLDPVIDLKSGALITGWLRTRVLFISLAVIIGILLLLLLPCICCICKCCGCIKDVVCCCCPKK